MGETEPGWLTVTDIARRLGRPDSTVRYWRNRFRPDLDTRTGEDGHPVYRLADFEQIDVMIRGRASRQEISARLTGRPQEAAATRDEPPEMLALLREIRDDLREIRALVERNAHGK